MGPRVRSTMLGHHRVWVIAASALCLATATATFVSLPQRSTSDYSRPRRLMKAAAAAARAPKCARRLSKELKKFHREAMPRVSIDAGDIMNWILNLAGPDGSPYEGGIFRVQIMYSDSYPMKAPELKFLTKCYHPSIDQTTDEVCQDVLARSKNGSEPFGIPQRGASCRHGYC